MDTNEKTLNDLLLDISCLDALNKYSEKINMFDVLKIQKAEIRHSNVLAWLLDANEQHGLNDSFISSFIQTILRENNGKGFPIAKWSLIDYSQEVVKREWHPFKSDSLDILILFPSEKLLMAIENKVDSAEGKGQTTRYYEDLQKTFPDYQKMLIYLSPFGENPEDDNWQPITYNEVLNSLLSALKNTAPREDAKKIINDYIEILRRDIVEDKELIDICTTIYKKHKEAFDLIWRYKKENSSMVAEFIKGIMKELNDDSTNDIVYSEDFDSGISYIRFGSQYIDDQLGESDNSNNIWNNKRRYFFEINPNALKNGNKEDIPIFFTLTGDNYNKSSLLYENLKSLLKKFEKDKINRICRAKTESKLLHKADTDFDVDDCERWLNDLAFKASLKHVILEFVEDTKKIVHSVFDDAEY